MAADDGAEHGECLAVLVALHQSTGVITGGSTAGGTSQGPLTASITRRQQRDSLLEVLLHLIEHVVVVAVCGIESVEGGISAVVGNQWRVLVITGEVVVGQAADEEGLSLDALHLIVQCSIVFSSTGEDEVTYINGVIPLTPRPESDVCRRSGVQIVEFLVPNLR